MVSKIMSYGSGITVLEPESLKNEIKKCALKIIENYK
ncbi:MAG: hypothetical protein IJX16_00520 [Clostridia bacterium]|nr:hypothetical protein [Clostridia bacterium]